MRAFLIFSIIPLFFIFSCTSQDKKDIISIINKREQALENKNVDLYKECIYENYSQTIKEKVLDKDKLLEKFKINTAAFDKISVTHKDQEIFIEENKATVLQSTEVLLTINDESSNYKIREVITLINTEKGWKIDKESKLDLFRGFVFGGKLNNQE